jgi:hypothetical protein
MWYDDGTHDGGEYCEECDRSFYGDWNTVAVDPFHDRFRCPHCGYVHPKTILSDYFYELGTYLLSPADTEHEAFPMTPPYMPKYEA